MRSVARATFLILVFALALPASGSQFRTCWSETIWDPVQLREITITRCRLAGGGIADYASDDAVPARLYPYPGIDSNGSCWYFSSSPGQWVFIDRYANGDANLGWNLDPVTPGGIVLDTGRVPRCTSEPIPLVPPEAAVWDYVTSYIHAPPSPDLSPRVGLGVTGMDTHAGVTVPEPHTATLSAGGLTLDLEIGVGAVVFDWGDGERDSFPPSAYPALTGYPDGIVIHVYEVKTADGYDLAVAYQWLARWRISGGPWQSLNVPDTVTTVNYPVGEIVSVLTNVR